MQDSVGKCYATTHFPLMFENEKRGHLKHRNTVGPTVNEKITNKINQFINFGEMMMPLGRFYSTMGARQGRVGLLKCA